MGTLKHDNGESETSYMFHKFQLNDNVLIYSNNLENFALKNIQQKHLEEMQESCLYKRCVILTGQMSGLHVHQGPEQSLKAATKLLKKLLLDTGNV